MVGHFLKAKVRKSLVALALAIFAGGVSAQETMPPTEPRQQAAQLASQGKYLKAIGIIEDEIKLKPQEGNLYFLLGQYVHYLCYDSRPLSGYNMEWSDSILGLLNKALALDSSLYDARYFLGSEYGVRTIQAMFRGDNKGMAEALESGYQAGGYPEWLLEYGANTLRACDSNAVLLVGGDAECFPIWYLQLRKKMRPDITVVPAYLLNRPWFVLALKNGKAIGRPAPISWDEEQILGRQPYQWTADTLEITVPAEKNPDGQPGVITWVVEPELSSPVSKYLGYPRAVIIDILETNGWDRPIFFSSGCPRSFMTGLEPYLQRCGLASRLLTKRIEKAEEALDLARMEGILLNAENFNSFVTLKTSPLPRISVLLNNYRAVHLGLAHYYFGREEFAKVKTVLDFTEKVMPSDIFPLLPDFSGTMEVMRDSLKVIEK